MRAGPAFISMTEKVIVMTYFCDVRSNSEILPRLNRRDPEIVQIELSNNDGMEMMPHLIPSCIHRAPNNPKLSGGKFSHFKDAPGPPAFRRTRASACGRALNLDAPRGVAAGRRR